jgi:hypothetical protein
LNNKQQSEVRSDISFDGDALESRSAMENHHFDFFEKSTLHKSQELLASAQKAIFNIDIYEFE